MCVRGLGGSNTATVTVTSSLDGTAGGERGLLAHHTLYAFPTTLQSTILVVLCVRSMGMAPMSAAERMSDEDEEADAAAAAAEAATALAKSGQMAPAAVSKKSTGDKDAAGERGLVQAPVCCVHACWGTTRNIPIVVPGWLMGRFLPHCFHTCLPGF